MKRVIAIMVIALLLTGCSGPVTGRVLGKYCDDADCYATIQKEHAAVSSTLHISTDVYASISVGQTCTFRSNNPGIYHFVSCK